MKYSPRIRPLVENYLPALLWAFFAMTSPGPIVANMIQDLTLLSWHNIGTVVHLLNYSLVVIFFFVRTPQRETSFAPFAVAAAFGGTFGPLLMHAVPGGWNHPIPIVMQLIGGVCAFFSLLSLNTSFGILPSDRGTKTVGAFRVVRHPLYASYLLANIGFLLSNTDLSNISVVGFVSILQIGRLNYEEQLLKKHPEYQEYSKEVRWRLIPGVY
ncbi:MAG: isoprenylcysteine carboxyl methyltransferase [Pseudomonadota bacterium]